MLERVHAAAEPAAHLFLRSLEAPTRSCRILGPTFWKNEGDNIVAPAWWPQYLAKIRGISQSQAYTGESFSNSPGRRSCLLTRNSSCSNRNSRRHGQHISSASTTPNSSRPYTNTPTRQREAAELAEIYSLEEDKEEVPSWLAEARVLKEEVDDELYEQNTPADSIDADQTTRTPTEDYSLERFSKLVRASNPAPADYDNAWKCFIGFSDQENYASVLFEYLARSKKRKDVERALSAFKLIPKAAKTEKLYQKALDLELTRFRHRNALGVALEGGMHGFKDALYPRLMAYFVKNLLWNAAADLWERANMKSNVMLSQPTPRQYSAFDEAEETRLLRECGEIVDLPEKMVALAERLQQNDAVYAERRKSLEAISQYLAYTAVKSRRVMGLITGKGLLTILQNQPKLGPISLHACALFTIHGLPEPGAKVQLALLVYRRWRLEHPEEKIPKWVIGSLISICGEAQMLPKTYGYLLQEARKHYGKPAEEFYQRVMTMCARQGESSAVHGFFSKYIKDYHEPASIGNVSPLLRVYAALGDPKNAQKQFDCILTKFGFRQNVECWNMLLLAHARSADEASAFGILDKMKSSDVKPDSYTYGTLLTICASQGDVDEALSLVEEARGRGLELTMPMITTLVEAFLSNGETERAEMLVETTTQNHRPEKCTRLWNTLLRQYAFAENSSGVVRIQQRMKALNVPADGMTYAALMTALVVMGRTQDAGQILRALHFSQKMSASLFHYSILLHGFAKEGNRDMTTVIYNEMQERFPRVSPSARKVVLELQSKREMTGKEEGGVETGRQDFSQKTALETLAEILIDISPSDFASKTPNPGFGRRSARSDLISVYFDSLVDLMIREDSYDQAEILIGYLEKLSESDPWKQKRAQELSMNILTRKMDIAIHRTDFKAVRDIWDTLFARYGGRRLAESRRQAETERGSGRKPQNEVPLASDQLRLPLSGQSPFSSMVDSSVSSPRNEALVPFSKRFALSIPLDKWLTSMDLALYHGDVIRFVNEVFPEAGFELTSKNWNKYIQILTKSSVSAHRVRAFREFEKRLLPNAPPWKFLRRGKWINTTASVTETAELDQEPISRRKLERTDPGLLTPTYFTAVYLGAALMKAQRKEDAGEGDEMRNLRVQAPKTLRFIRAMPYLRDRIQGVLLRGRKIIGDLHRRPRSNDARAYQGDVAGIKGSRSPFDNIPVEDMETIENAIAPRDDIRALLKGVSDERMVRRSPQNLRLAERISGEILRNAAILPRAGRFENEQETQRRIKKEESRRFGILETVRRDGISRLLVSDEYRGEPNIGRYPLQRRTDNAGQDLSADYIRSEDLLDSADFLPRDVNSDDRKRFKTERQAKRGLNPINLKLLAKRIPVQRDPKDNSIVPQSYVSNRQAKAFTRNKARRLAQKQEASEANKIRNTQRYRRSNDQGSGQAEKSSVAEFKPFVANEAARF